MENNYGDFYGRHSFLMGFEQWDTCNYTFGLSKVVRGLSSISLESPAEWSHGDSSINKKSTGLQELGSVLEPLVMALGL